jgi:methylmalonyl-CoA mutase
MKKGGFEPIKAFSKIHFSFSFDSQLFYNQAKVRAFRFLLSRVIEAYGGDREQQKPKIYGRTSLRMLSKYDAWTNIMRITTATLGACLSDIDSIESFDHNRILVEELESEESQTLSRRIARNCSHILSDESFMGQVMDPAGGSYFIENLTNEYAMKAWEIFQKIEQDGGMGECLNKGIIQEQVKEITKMRKENIHLRKENVIGVSKFALSSQALLENWKPKEKSSFHLHEKDCEAKLTKKIVKKSREYVAYDYKDETLGEILMDSYVEGFTLEKASQILHSQAQKDKIEPLEKYRTAHDFEKLRFFIEQENLKSQWKIRYIVCGDLKKLNPQLLFAKDIFDSLGIESEEVFTNDVSEIEANDCHINVYICDQELLDESGAAVMKLLKKKRNLIYTTKKLKEAQLEELKAAGLEESLYSGMNVYQNTSSCSEGTWRL